MGFPGSKRSSPWRCSGKTNHAGFVAVTGVLPAEARRGGDGPDRHGGAPRPAAGPGSRCASAAPHPRAGASPPLPLAPRRAPPPGGALGRGSGAGLGPRAAPRRPPRPPLRASLPSQQARDLLRRQRAELPGLEALRGDRAEGHPPQLRDRVPHRLEQPLHLVLLALVERHLDPGVVVGLDDAGAVHGHEVAFHPDPALQPLERLRLGHPVDLGVVDAGHLVARVGDALREGSVVGQQDQALGRHVEPPDREEPGEVGDEVHHRRPPRGVLPRGDDAAGLVEDEVHVGLRCLHPDAVHAHVVRGEVGLRPELAHVLAVHRDPALQHQLLGPAPRGEAGPGQDLLESLFHGRDVIAKPGTAPRGRPLGTLLRSLPARTRVADGPARECSLIAAGSGPEAIPRLSRSLRRSLASTRGAPAGGHWPSAVRPLRGGVPGAPQRAHALPR